MHIKKSLNLTLDLQLFAASRLQLSQIAAGMKLQKGGLEVSDLYDTPEANICCVSLQNKSK